MVEPEYLVAHRFLHASTCQLSIGSMSADCKLTYSSVRPLAREVNKCYARSLHRNEDRPFGFANAEA